MSEDEHEHEHEHEDVYDMIEELRSEDELQESNNKSGLYYHESGDLLVFFDTRKMSDGTDFENFNIYGAKVDSQGDLQNTDEYIYVGITKKVRSMIESMKSQNLDKWSE